MGFKNKGMWLSSKEADMIDLYRKQSPSVKKATCQQVGVAYDSKKDGKSSKNKKRW
ncbi:MAG: hypothetical protein MJ147_08490 [Clostridia bacterium]|nr:hypothetical protein [Clostridia bacterium]